MSGLFDRLVPTSRSRRTGKPFQTIAVGEMANALELVRIDVWKRLDVVQHFDGKLAANQGVTDRLDSAERRDLGRLIASATTIDYISRFRSLTEMAKGFSVTEFQWRRGLNV